MNHQTISNKNHVYKMAVLISYFFLKAFFRMYKREWHPVACIYREIPKCIWIYKIGRIWDPIDQKVDSSVSPLSNPRLRFSPYALIPAGYQPLSPLPSGRERIFKMLKSGLKIIIKF